MEKLDVGLSLLKMDSRHVETLALDTDKVCFQANLVGAPFQSHGGLLEEKFAALEFGRESGRVLMLLIVRNGHYYPFCDADA